MPLFFYKALGERNTIIQDTIQAGSAEDAATLLRAEGNQVLTVKRVDDVPVFLSRQVSVSEKAAFCRFLSTMLRAGLSLPESVEIIKQESRNKQMQKILAQVATKSRQGQSLSSIIIEFPDVFDPVFITLVKVGEEAGTLEQTLKYLAKQLLATYELNQKVKGALIYPAVVLSAMLGVGVVMLVFVLPRIAGVFLNMNIKLPRVTQFMLQLGNFVGLHVQEVLAAISLSIILTVGLMMNRATRRVLLTVLGRFPAVKKIVTQVDIARFSRTLAILLKSGVPIVDALSVASGSISQRYLREYAQRFGGGIAKGESLSEIMTETKHTFPPIMIQTIRAGEKTGKLEEVLMDLAKFYEQEIEHSLKNVIALLEPGLMLIIGIVVGVMVILFIAPIYSIIGGLQSSIQR